MTDFQPGGPGDPKPRESDDEAPHTEQYTARHPTPPAQSADGQSRNPTPVPTVEAPGQGDTSSVEPGMVILENYEIKKLLASGGMGSVYLAEHTELGTRHAIKVIKPQLLGNEMIRPLTRREAMVLSQINNDAVVAYHGFLKDNRGNYYLIMEYVEGPSLKQAMADKSLSVEDYYVLRRRLAQGLMALHQHGVVHRDLSPDNVILQDNDLTRAKLIDLGIAKLIKTDVENTIIGDNFAGKLRYASPEQLGMYGGEVGPPADIYSLGLVLVAALLGKPLAMGANPIAACAARMEVPDLEGVPKVLRPQLTALLQPEPGNRPQDLETFLKAWPDPYTKSDTTLRTWPLAAAGLGLVLLGGGLAYSLWSPDPGALPPGELVAYFQEALAAGNIRDADGHFQVLRSQYPDYPELAALAGNLERLRTSSAATLTTAVIQALKDRDLELAARELERLHAIDPGHESLARLRAELQRGRDQTARVTRLENLLANAEPTTDELLAGRQTLTALAKLDDGHPRLAVLEAQLEARIDARAQALLAATETALADADPDATASHLQGLSRLLPDDDARLADLEQQRVRLGQTLQLMERLRQALVAGKLLEARQWWQNLQVLAVDHPELAPLASQLQAAVAARVAELAEQFDEQLADYRLAEAEQTIAEIARLDSQGSHRQTREALVGRLDRVQGVVAQAGDVRAAIQDEDALAARRRLERLRGIAPDYPEIPSLAAQLDPLLESAVAGLVAQAREAHRQGELAALREVHARITQLLPDHPQLATVTDWIKALETVPDTAHRDRLLAQFQGALDDAQLDEARRLLSVLRGEPGTDNRIPDLEEALATAHLGKLQRLLETDESRRFAGQLESFRVFLAETGRGEALGRGLAGELAALGEALLAAVERALTGHDLDAARQLLPGLDDFLAGADPRLLDIRERLALATALSGCRTEQYRQDPDSRPSLRTAMQCFQEVLRRYPGNPEAAQEMATLADRHAALVRQLWEQGKRRQAEGVLEDLLGFASRYPGLDALLAGLPGISFAEPLMDGVAGPRMVVVPAGEVLLVDGERSLRTTLARPFAVSRFEISRAEFSHFVDAQGGYRTDAENYAARGNGCFYRDARGDVVTDDTQSNWKTPRFPQQSSHPVVCVTVKDALLFSRWLSTQTDRAYRLPTDLEWEYLARAGNLTPSFWSQLGNTDTCESANLRQGDIGTGCRDTADYTTATGRFESNAFGIFDLLGNAAEWTCSDAEGGTAALDTCLDANDMQQSLRDGAPAQVLVRGGSWYNSPEKLVDGGEYRVPLEIHYPFNQIGFRVIRELALEDDAVAAAADTR